MSTPQEPTGAHSLGRVKQPNDRRSTASTWKRNSGVDLELPSGNVCLVKRPGMEKLLNSGILPDELTPIAMAQVAKAQQGQPTDDKAFEREMLAKIAGNNKLITKLMESFDRVIEMVVMDPPVRLHFEDVLGDDGKNILDEEGNPVVREIPEDERDPDVLYTDYVDQDDKNFIFQYVVGGTADLERFREEQRSAVQASSDSPDVPGQALGSPGSD